SKPGSDWPARDVSSRHKRVALVDLLAELTGKDAVLTASPHLLDRRITISEHQTRLSDVMDWTARPWSRPRYPARWRRTGGGRYVLEQDASAASELHVLVERERSEIVRDLARLTSVVDQDEADLRERFKDGVGAAMLQGRRWSLHGRSA